MTIYDIAKEAGVSASSVSRVVNGKPGVNARTRELIETLLVKYNYIPNDVARGLATKSSKLVGILISDIRSQHLNEGVHHIVRALSREGYSALIINAGDTPADWAKEIRMLEQRVVESLVLMGSIFQCKEVRNAIVQCMPKTPVFMLNGHIDLPNVYSVMNDERNGVKKCVALLAERGKKHIAFLVDKPTPSSKLKEEGFLDGMREYYSPKQKVLVYRGVEGSVQGGYETVIQALAENKKLDGLICSLDIIACGALHALREKGIRVPEDAAVIGIDNSVYTEICSPKLTSLDNMIFDSAGEIAHKLVDVLSGEVTNQRTVLLTTIIERGST